MKLQRNKWKLFSQKKREENKCKQTAVAIEGRVRQVHVKGFISSRRLSQVFPLRSWTPLLSLSSPSSCFFIFVVSLPPPSSFGFCCPYSRERERHELKTCGGASSLEMDTPEKTQIAPSSTPISKFEVPNSHPMICCHSVNRADFLRSLSVFYWIPSGFLRLSQ